MSEKFCSYCGIKFKTFDKDVYFCSRCLPGELKKQGKVVSNTCAVCHKDVKEDESYIFMTFIGLFYGVNYCKCHLVCTHKHLKKEVEDTVKAYKKTLENTKLAEANTIEAKRLYEDFIKTYETELVVNKL